jgi:hypothetical protein
VKSATLPIFFARVFSLLPGGNYSGTTVSATATAEAFNPSDSGLLPAGMIPVQPRCVKPWIIPNVDPGNGLSKFVSLIDGAIINQGVWSVNKGSVGEPFNLNADCVPGRSNCSGANLSSPSPSVVVGVPPALQYLQYVPALVAGAVSAVPSCAAAGYQAAIAGCDQTTVYTCGTSSATAGATQIDLSENPVNPSAINGDTASATQCLINNSTGAGQDALDAGSVTSPVFPFLIQAGTANPLAKAGTVPGGAPISSSNSIVTVPIYDNTLPLTGVSQPVTIVGFLQVFINQVNPDGSLAVTVMNVSGCSNTAAGNPTVTGSSPVPIRLITQP